MDQQPPSGGHPHPQGDAHGQAGPAGSTGARKRRRRKKRRGKGGAPDAATNLSPNQGPDQPAPAADAPSPDTVEATAPPTAATYPAPSAAPAPRPPQHNQPHHNHRQQQHRPPPGPPPKHYDVTIAGFDPRTAPMVKPFDQMTVIDPRPRLTLEHRGCAESCRLIDLFCPIGRGQRALIVSPPKAGKTTLLKDVSSAIVHNHPDVTVLALLIDERPEEVTDFSRTFRAFGTHPDGSPRAHVVASSNDHSTDRHVSIAIGTMELTKRMVEAGRHVVVVLDSITRLARAFNNSRRYANSGRTMSGGIDAKALEVPRQIFGSARNTEEAGSLTIIATCLVDTGSQMDQVIFEEFKGSGNMELILDRKIAERRLFPAINLAASGTRKEDLLLDERTYKTVTALRRRLLSMPPPVQVEQLLSAMKRFPDNNALVGTAG